MMKVCKTTGCVRACAKNRALCYPCKLKREKEIDLVRWAYSKWKSNAKQRNIPFAISLEYFRQFCIETQIMNGRGIYGHSLHIDKIDDALGYIPGNIRPITNSENAKKENARRKRVAFVPAYDEYGDCRTTGGRLRMVEDAPETDEFEELPF